MNTERSAPGARLGAAWAGLDPRERRLSTLAAALIALALLWWLALAPALAVLRDASSQRAALQAQAERMQALKAQAEALKGQPRLAREDAVRALEESVKQRLRPTAQLSVVGDRANLVLKDTPAEALAAWLAEARANARVLPLEARLARGASQGASPSWSGTLSLGLPP